MARRFPPRRNSLDPRDAARDLADLAAVFLRDLCTQGLLGNNNDAPRLATNRPPGAAAHRARSPSSASTSKRRRSPRPPRYDPGRRRYSYSPEYRHEYGPQHQGYAVHSGPSHYQAASHRPRSPYGGSSPRYRDNAPPHRGNGERREVRGRERDFRARHPSPHRSPKREQGTARPSTSNKTTVSHGDADPVLNAPLAANFRATPPPNLATALRDRRGHPQFPGHDDYDPAAALARTKSYKEQEGARVRRTAKKGTGSSRVPAPRNLAALGLWYNVHIETYHDARNLLRWANAGEHQARRLVLHIEQQFGVRACDARNEGIAYVMSQQNASRLAYLWATTGTVPVKREKRDKSPFNDDELTPDPLPSALDDDREMPPVPRDEKTPKAASHVTSYLGCSPSTIDDFFDIPNSGMSAMEARVYYQALQAGEWPSAMRTTDGEYPTSQAGYGGRCREPAIRGAVHAHVLY
ncbi:hypothetical protein C8R47DRAFT_1082416 [Mycena vitilis]|nr:hypothetical protein C8R47DRAFT_1082416 [Mycena vitilis]